MQTGEPAFRWNDDDTLAEASLPWLTDAEGRAVRLPAEAIGYRVRYWPPGGAGMGELVCDEDNGTTLLVRRTATREEFLAHVGYRVGRYKLAAVDASCEFVPHVRVGVFTVTAKMAAAAEPASAAPAPSSSERMLEIMMERVAEAHRAAAAEVAEVHRQGAEERRATAAEVAEAHRQGAEAHRAAAAQIADAHRIAAGQLDQLVTNLAGILRAAGESGVVAKTTALDAAAAGAPVVVHQGPGMPPAIPPAGAAGNGLDVEKEGAGAMVTALMAPVIERLAPVLAYGAAKKLDCPEDVARDVFGFVGTVAKTAGQMMRAEAAPMTPSDPGAAVERMPLNGAALMGHVVRIQGALDAEERAWIASKLGTHGHLLEDLKAAVATMTVEEGAQAVRTLRGVEVLFTPGERAIFEKVYGMPGGLRSIWNATFAGRTAEEAVGVLRARLFRTAAANGHDVMSSPSP